MMHRVRDTWGERNEQFSGPIEVDETYVGGLKRNKHADKKLHPGGGGGGKTAVVGVLDPNTKKVVAEPIERTDRFTLGRLFTQARAKV